MTTPEKIDVIGDVLGHFGKFQLRTILLMFLCKIPTSWFMAIVIYTAPAPNYDDFYCKPLRNISLTDTDWIQLAHPKIPSINNGNGWEIDYCNVYADAMNYPNEYYEYKTNGTNKSALNLIYEFNKTIIPCEQFIFRERDGFHSIIAQFNLVCSRSLLLPLTQCIHIFGLLVGGIIAYIMVKFISPRHVMLTGMISQVICGNCAGLVRTYILHLIFRGLSAASCALMYSSALIICHDITAGKAKKITSIVFELFWSIGLILLPSLSIFFNSWSQLYMAISWPTLILIFLHRYIPDSPRWLIKKARVDEARIIVREGGRLNKRKIPDNFDQLMQKQADECLLDEPQATWWSLWDGTIRKRHVLCVHYAWSIYVLLFNSMVLNIRAFGRDHIDMNTVTIGFSEMFGVAFGMYFILYTRRRWLWTGILSITAGIAAYLTWLIPDDLHKTHKVALEMIPSAAIKLAVSSSMAVLTTCTSELVPEDKRKTLMLSVVIWARAWFLWAPFIYLLKAYGILIPLTVFATLAIAGGILTSIINHSHHKSHKKQQIRRRRQIEENIEIDTVSNKVEKNGV